MGLSVVRENLGGVMGRVRILTGCHFVFGGMSSSTLWARASAEWARQRMGGRSVSEGYNVVREVSIDSEEKGGKRVKCGSIANWAGNQLVQDLWDH